MSGIGYNSNDPYIQAFLSSLALGETGGAQDSQYLGVGGTSLQSIVTAGHVDEYGFPIWEGFGNSHAAGTWQFQPGTWDEVAAEHNLNFASKTDQAQAAWYYAQEKDPTLYDDIRNGNFSKITSALASVWPSVTGNGAAPGGLTASLTSLLKAGPNTGEPWAIDWFGNGTAVSGNAGLVNAPKPGDTPASGMGFGLGGIFTQWSLIAVGAVVVFVALWMLLSSQNAKTA